MKFLKPVVIASALVLGLVPTAFAQAGASGDWEITLETPQGASTVSLSLTQDGDKVSGNLSSPMGAVPISGTAAAGALALVAHIDIQGNALDLGLNGKVDGDALTGTVKFGDFGEFPFTGKRGAPKAAAAAAAAAPTPAVSLPATDANGKWNIVLTLAGAGEFPVDATLKQEGEKVTGTLVSAAGEVAVAGTMTGTALKLQFTAETPQGPLPITMTGDLSPQGFTGKATIEGLGEADWTATKVQ